ncbi:acyl-CoA N-acyltransferase [Trametes sanguinea]|nr:acyl-CoA N-acyltransferase [Trametes sanguinea]
MLQHSVCSIRYGPCIASVTLFLFLFLFLTLIQSGVMSQSLSLFDFSQTVMSIDINIRRISADETVPLRHSVLWPDHPVSHVLLPEDSSGFHYGAFLLDSSTPVAVISAFYDPLPPTTDSPASPSQPPETAQRTARFRKFACDPAYQGKGIGTRLLQHVFDVAAKEMGCSVVWCDARRSAAGWYERRGMRRFGEMFFKGDIEYVRMMREL